MSSPNKRYPVRLATSADSEAVRRVLESGSFPGKIQVQFTRRPDPLRSWELDGDEAVIAVAEDSRTGEVVGVGGCVLRYAWVNGMLVQTGYLTGMKLLEHYRKRANCIRDAYDLIHRETKDRCSLYVTTILSDNPEVIRLLERPRKGIPAYGFQGDYAVFCLGTWRKEPRLPEGLSVQRNPAGLEAFYNSFLPQYQLAPRFGDLHGLPVADFDTLRNRQGDILAAWAVWNQQRYKQYTVTGYGGVYSLLQHLPVHRMGYPRIPEAGVPANCACIAMLMVRPDCMDMGETVIRLAAARARGYAFVMLGLHAGHPLSSSAERLRHIRYSSRVYTVDFGHGLSLKKGPLLLETGLL